MAAGLPDGKHISSPVQDTLLKPSNEAFCKTTVFHGNAPLNNLT